MYRMVKAASFLMSGVVRREYASIPSTGAEVRAQLQGEIGAAFATRRHSRSAGAECSTL
jgi:hypothetical protein